MLVQLLAFHLRNRLLHLWSQSFSLPSNQIFILTLAIVISYLLIKISWRDIRFTCLLHPIFRSILHISRRDKKIFTAILLLFLVDKIVRVVWIIPKVVLVGVGFPGGRVDLAMDFRLQVDEGCFVGCVVEYWWLEYGLRYGWLLVVDFDGHG